MEPTSEPSEWADVMRAVHGITPRVGNLSCSADSQVFQMIQQRLTQLQVVSVFCCRGTERFQVPLAAPSPQEAPIRYTVCVRRQSNQIEDLGAEEWGKLNRSQRLRKSVPSSLTVTVFARPSVPSEPSQRSDDPENPTEPAVPLSSADSLRRQSPSAEWSESWAPPPTPLHGPKFRSLSHGQKQDLILLHKNLGHPDPERLAQHLKAQGASQDVIDGARDFVCDACVESTRERHQRPAKLHEPTEFNQVVGIDGFFWRGQAGFQVHVLHCVDEASMFQLGRRLSEGKDPTTTFNVWQEFWMAWVASLPRPCR